jgi:hypothetical protein
MADASATLQPRRRRWKRWVALAFVLALACGVWLASRASLTMRNAQQLRLGMRHSEVEAVMGKPTSALMISRPSISSWPVMRYSYATPSEIRLHDLHYWLWKRGFRTRHPPQYPVEVQMSFTGAGIIYIRRGNEVVSK